MTYPNTESPGWRRCPRWVRQCRPSSSVMPNWLVFTTQQSAKVCWSKKQKMYQKYIFQSPTLTLNAIDMSFDGKYPAKQFQYNRTLHYWADLARITVNHMIHLLAMLGLPWRFRCCSTKYITFSIKIWKISRTFLSHWYNWHCHFTLQNYTEMTVSGEMTLFVTVEKWTLIIWEPAFCQNLSRFHREDFFVGENL